MAKGRSLAFAPAMSACLPTTTIPPTVLLISLSSSSGAAHLNINNIGRIAARDPQDGISEEKLATLEQQSWLLPPVSPR